MSAWTELLPHRWTAADRASVAALVEPGTAGAFAAGLRTLAARPDRAQSREFALGIVSTFTVAPQLAAVEFALAATGVRPRMIVGDRDVIEPDLLDPQGPTLSAGPDAVLVLWRLDELAPALVAESAAWSPARRRETVAMVEARMREFAGRFAEASPATLILSTLPASDPPGGAQADLHRPAGLGWAIAHLNAALREVAAEFAHVRLFDLAGFFAQEGAAGYDPRFDLFALQPIAGCALGGFARALRRSFGPLANPPAKVLALDLDNTLWGGVLGEDGVEGLAIGHDFPGSVFRKIQQEALALRARGVLLALVSKNEEADVREAFARLQDMPLKLSDFAAMRIDWNPKPDNLRAIADDLELGLDAFVFVDDQPFERAAVVAGTPEVRVLPTDGTPLGTLAALRASAHFDQHRTTASDLGRAQDYALRRDRKELEHNATSRETFLRSLGLKARVASVDVGSLGRAVQMLAKTNQFNVTTRRHGEADLKRMLAQKSARLLTLSLADRFGDQGIVGLAIALPERDGGAHVDSFLMSCRALGRGAEETLWASLCRRLAEAGVSRLSAEYLPTPKNAQCADLFDRLGMVRLPGDDTARRYAMTLPGAAGNPDWIETEEV
ncbi:MAG: HAD-IIIC family phosphatase [Proteobacteria bacterium]|nr:HAD-IIIC family phosphatase [Pseudomonadota bacterium]